MASHLEAMEDKTMPLPEVKTEEPVITSIAAEEGGEDCDSPVPVPPAVATSNDGEIAATLSRKPVCTPWTSVTQWMHGLLKTGVLNCALHAAKYPFHYVGVISAISVGLVVIGLFTNFRLELDIEAILSPTGSQPALVRF